MIRIIITLGVSATLLVGCGQKAGSPTETTAKGAESIATSGIKRLSNVLKVQNTKFSTPTKEQIAKLKAPAILVQSNGVVKTATFSLAADLNGYRTYFDATQDSITTQGDALVQTRGLGRDLMGVELNPSSELLKARKPVNWADSEIRTYYNMGDDWAVGPMKTECIREKKGMESTKVLEEMQNLYKIREVCNGPKRAFVNYYWIRPSNGTIVKSIQWVDYATPPLELTELKR